MIDFRYHLVSLISVFLALAVGIVLGAGPLRESLGSQLAGQVEQLRTEKEQLRADNERFSTQTDQLGAYVSDTAPALVAGRLKGSSVAIIADDSSIRASTDEIAGLIADAGGTVTARVTLGSNLWDPAQAQARSSAVAALREQAPALALSGDDDSARLSTAVVTVLTTSSRTLPETQRDAALDVLASAKMITVDAAPTATADAIVDASASGSSFLVSGDDSARAADRAQALTTVQTSVLDAVVAADLPAVVVGATPGSDATTGIIRTARGDARYEQIATVDGLQRADGPPVAVLALAARIQGTAGDYGTGAGAQSRIPTDLTDDDGAGTSGTSTSSSTGSASDGGGQG